MPDDKETQIHSLCSQLSGLSTSQLTWLEQLIHQFVGSPHHFTIGDSDFIDTCFLNSFGDSLLVHHCLSEASLSKDRFEHLLTSSARLCGRSATLAPPNNPGHDVTIDGVRYSLKTQADSNLKVSTIHISKFMELGKGAWGSNPSDLEGLLRQFLHHLERYERILVLRTLAKPPNPWEYELVEIPKKLLQEAANGTLEMNLKSQQNPKPGYCRVYDVNKAEKFRLYFDGGGERKLQVQNISKALCRVHATWQVGSGQQITLNI